MRAAIVQFRPDKGEYQANLERLGQFFHEAAALTPRPELLILPESALTGYFLEGGTQELAVSAEQLYADLSRVHAGTGTPPVDIALGFYEVWRNHLHNSALYATLGGPEAGIRHVHRKVFLPTYGVFDEERFVEPGRSVQAFDTRWGRCAMLVCEDAWHSLTPTIAALDGAQVVLVPSATPARGLLPREHGDSRPTNLDRWDRLAQGIAEEHGVYVVVSHLVGFEGGKGFVGGSIVAGPRGNTVAEGPLFEAAIVPFDLNFGEITRARAEAPLLSDLQVRLPHLMSSLAEAGNKSSVMSHESRVEHSSTHDSRLTTQGLAPSTAGSNVPLAIDAELTRQWLVQFIRDEITRRRGFKKVVIGLSGGVDSALVTFLAAEALGAENVTAIRMPYQSSSRESLDHAQLVIDQLKLPNRTVEITAGVDGIVGAIGGDSSPARRGNVMARMRMITLFDLSTELSALPLGTGNKTERLFGYFTWHADDSPPVNPIGDLFKSQVWALARHVGVPDVIVSKPATADLIQGQTDEGDFGISYPRADVILHWLLQGYHAPQIEPLGFTAAEVALVQKRLDSTHWKRRLPTVAMVSQTAIGEYYLRPVDY